MKVLITGEAVCIKDVGKLIKISADGATIDSHVTDNLHPSYLSCVPEGHAAEQAAVELGKRWFEYRRELGA